MTRYYVNSKSFDYPMDAAMYAININALVMYEVTDNTITDYYEMTADYIRFIETL